MKYEKSQTANVVTDTLALAFAFAAAEEERGPEPVPELPDGEGERGR
jgi:hypothetical protein